MSAPDEQRLDVIVWPKLGKRFRECTPDELAQVIAGFIADAALVERRIARALAKIDQYEATVADGVTRAEQWANGGAL